MGGRSSYPADRITGRSQKVKKSLNTLKDFLSKEEPKQAARAATEVIANSPKAIKISALGLRLAPAIARNRKEWQASTDEEAVRRDIGAKWVEAKKKHSIKVDKEIDRAVVESALKAVRGGGR